MTVLLDAGSAGATTVITGGLHASATSNIKNGARADTLRSNATLASPLNRFWFEVTNNFVSLATDSGTGVCISATPNYTNLANNGTGGLIVFRSGVIWLNGVNISTQITGGITTDSVMFALDFDNALLWGRTPGSFWNGSALNNPDTGVGGIDISTISGAGLYPIGIITSLANAFDANFGASTPVNTAPTTFSPWDMSTPPPPVVPTRHAVHNARMRGFTNNAAAVAQGVVISFTLSSTEASDTFTAQVSPSIGLTMQMTETPDTWHVVSPDRYNVGGLNTPDLLADDDVIYVLENNETIYVPGDFSSSFIIPSDDTMYAV